MKRPSIAAIFSPQLARTTIITTIMFACSYGAAFGAIQQMPQIVAGLPQVQEKIKTAVAEAIKKPATAPGAAATKAATMPGVPSAVPQGAKIPPGTTVPDPRARAASGLVIQETAASVTKIQELGGLLGRVIFAILATMILSRRTQIRVFQVPGLIVMPLVFWFFALKDLNLLTVGMFLAGLLTVAQFSFWGNYLPQVYPMHLRGTGESFAANIGGRMIGTSFAALTAFIAGRVTDKNATPAEAAHIWAITAGAVGFAVYLVGFLTSFLLPEPKIQQDEE